MTERLSDILTKIQNVQQIEAVVTAMRGIAASRAQNGRALLEGIEAYTAVISHAVGQALNLQPAGIVASAPPPSKRGLILFGAEQGFAGSFSERVLDAAGTDLQAAACLIVGTRGTAVAKERGITPDWSTAMMTRVESISGFANQLVEVLYDYVANRDVAAFDIIFSRFDLGGIRVDRHSLLPIDFERFERPIERQLPLTELAPELLLERLAEEYVYAQLCQAAIHAFVAENEARMIAMMAAKNNSRTTLTGLMRRERQLRQEEITTEITELVAGAEAARI